MVLLDWRLSCASPARDRSRAGKVAWFCILRVRVSGAADGGCGEAQLTSGEMRKERERTGMRKEREHGW